MSKSTPAEVYRTWPAMYAAGQTAPQIAEAHGVNATTVYFWLKKQGVSIRPPVYNYVPPNIADLRQVTEDGHSVVRIPLTRGLFAIVDEADAPALLSFKWQVSGGVKGTYYAKRSTTTGSRNSKAYVAMHRVITGAPPGVVVDHIDGDGLNNRRANLRICSQAENAFNRGAHASNTLGLKGVQREGQAYAVRIQSRGIQHYLGSFETAELAARAYDAAAVILHGDFARLNYPNENERPDGNPALATNSDLSSSAASVAHPLSLTAFLSNTEPQT